MSTQKQKFDLYARLQELGFTYEEAVSLRRIEMTLSRWSEQECGDEHGRCIERDEATNKPYMTYDKGRNGERGRYPIADREAGAFRRLGDIVGTRNARESVKYLPGGASTSPYADKIIPYHQGDPRGSALYLVKRSDLIRNGEILPIESYYTRGLAVCC